MVNPLPNPTLIFQWLVPLFDGARVCWHKILKHEYSCSELNTDQYRFSLYSSLGSRWFTLPILQPLEGPLNLPEWCSDLQPSHPLRRQRDPFQLHIRRIKTVFPTTL